MKIEEDIVDKVLEDFKKRQNDRKQFEAIWQLNMNFFMGNQYCSIAITLLQHLTLDLLNFKR